MPKVSLLGLGRPTLRGVRKCPKCNALSGTRANHCKNKLCGATFKESVGKKKCSAEACRLNTGTTTRVYSVRVRDKGPDYRGFVQLPVVQAPFAESTGVIESSALCFVDNCVGNFNANVLQCHEPLDEEKVVALCNHICGALRCSNEAQELPVNATILESLSIEESCKKEILTLLSESTGPTVQRVSRNVMAVKCRVSPKSPLGYLHVSFASGRPEHDIQFSCPCSTFKDSAGVRSIDGRCPHFYACICAFVNQESLREEFSSYIKLEVVIDPPIAEVEDITSKDERSVEADCDFASLLESNGCHVAILQDDVSSLLSQTISEDVNSMLAKTITEDAIVFSTVGDLESSSIDSLKQVSVNGDQELGSSLGDSDGEAKQLAAISALDLVASTSMIPSVDLLTADLQGSSQNDIESAQLIPLYLETIIEQPLYQQPFKKRTGGGKQQLSFAEWLGGVTDTINQQMHYQFPGKPNALVFQVHKKFFDKFKERITRTRRKHLSSSVTIFSRRDQRPVGTFVKHSWSVSSRISVKAIFDTPQIPLNLVRSFIRNSDGTFDPADSSNSTGSILYKTYLRVGQHRGEKEPVPFKMDWIPNTLPCSQVGELGIHFEFGHVPFCLGSSCQETTGR